MENSIHFLLILIHELKQTNKGHSYRRPQKDLVLLYSRSEGSIVIIKNLTSSFWLISVSVRLSQTPKRRFRENFCERLQINPYSAKGLGDRLYATLNKMPEEVGYTFCLFLFSRKTLPYTHLEATS